MLKKLKKFFFGEEKIFVFAKEDENVITVRAFVDDESAIEYMGRISYDCYPISSRRELLEETSILLHLHPNAEVRPRNKYLFEIILNPTE